MEFHAEGDYEAKESAGGCARAAVQLRGIYVALYVSDVNCDCLDDLGFGNWDRVRIRLGGRVWMF